MAYSYSKTMLTTSLALTLFLITGPQPSHGVLINGINIAQIEVLGRVFCTATGNPDPTCGDQQCPPLSGAPVTVSCFGGRTTLGQAVTNTAGAIRVVVSTLDSVVFDPSACGVYVKLPVVSCAALPPTGNISSVLMLLDIVQGATGGVARLTTSVFQVVGDL